MAVAWRSRSEGMRRRTGAEAGTKLAGLSASERDSRDAIDKVGDLGRAGYHCCERGSNMDPISTAVLAGLMNVAADAAKDTTNHLATSAWGKIKNALGWTTDPAPAELKASAEKTLATKPEAAQQVQQIVNDYRQQVGGVSVGTVGSINLAGATVGTVKQPNIGQNLGTINL